MVDPQQRYDHGPPQAWADLFGDAPLASYQALASAFRLEFGPVFYRGRLNGSARVLVVRQDPSTDELLAQRILVGTAGQRVQRLLAKLGLTHSYVMFNTFLYGIFGQLNDAKAALQTNPAADVAVQAFRNQLFDRVRSTSTLSAILAFDWATAPELPETNAHGTPTLFYANIYSTSSCLPGCRRVRPRCEAAPRQLLWMARVPQRIGPRRRCPPVAD